MSFVCSSIAATAASAESRVSASVNGKKIEVSSDQPNSSIRTSNGNAVIRSGDITVQLDGQTLTVGTHSVELGNFEQIDVTIAGGEARVSVDGRPMNDLN